MLSALQYVLKWFFGGVVFLWVLMVSACLGIKRQRNSSEIKYLNLVRWKVIGSSQDCTTVSNSIRERVIAAKISVGVSILIGIISNEYFTPPMATKCWTDIWHTVNSKWWLTRLYHALKWCKSFLVHQRENKYQPSFLPLSIRKLRRIDLLFSKKNTNPRDNLRSGVALPRKKGKGKEGRRPDRTSSAQKPSWNKEMASLRCYGSHDLAIRQLWWPLWMKNSGWWVGPVLLFS